MRANRERETEREREGGPTYECHVPGTTLLPCSTLFARIAARPATEQTAAATCSFMCAALRADFDRRASAAR